MRRVISVLSLFIANLFSINAHALDTTMELAFSAGGDKFATVTSAQDVLFGDGYSLGFGLRQKINNSLSITSSLSLKNKSGNYVQGTLRFVSMPVTLGIKTNFGKGYGIEIGGIKYLEAKASGTALASNVDIVSNMGIYADFMLISNNSLELGLRLISELEFKNAANQTWKGDHGSLIIRFIY